MARRAQGGLWGTGWRRSRVGGDGGLGWRRPGLTAARWWWWLWLWLWLVEVVVEVVRETLLVRRGESSCLAAGWRVGGRWGGTVGWSENEL